MSPENLLTTLRWLLSENLLLQRLFFASVELAALALVVVLLVRLGRIRSPRLISLLWLVVLIKPIASLAVGSPLPIVLLEAPAPEPELIARSPTFEQPLMAGVSDPILSPVETLKGQETSGTSASLVPTPVSPAPEVQSDWRQDSLWQHLARGLVVTWIAGVLLLLGRHLLARVRLYRIVRAAEAASPLVQSRYRSIASQMGLKRMPRLLVTDVLDSPALAGLLRPAILLPSWMAADAADPKLDWSLRHELMHRKWLDPFVIFVRDVAAILFHFHPVAWWAGKRQTEAMELACDRALLVNDSDATDYAEQLYQILKNIRHRRRVAIAGGLFATRTQVGQRIAALLGAKITSRPQLSAFAVLGVLLLAAGALAVGGGVRIGEPAESSGKTAGKERVLRFPGTRPVGNILIRQPRPQGGDWGEGWEWMGRMRGTVRVPADKDVRLWLFDAAKDYRTLSGFAPDDIQVLELGGRPSDALMASLGNLTGLKSLKLMGDRLPGKTGLAHLAELKELERLCLLHLRVTDDDLRTLASHLRGLKSFKSLEFYDTDLTDAGLAHLRQVRSLENLTFGSDRMTGSGFAHLADLPQLEGLTFRSQVATGDKVLQSVAQCASLKRLTPNCPGITEAGWAHLARLKSLETLNLGSVRVGDAGLAHLSALKSLRTLNLKSSGWGPKLGNANVAVTDAGLAHLAKLTLLERLTLPGGLSDVGLANLRNLKGLKHLDLSRVQFTGEGLKSLSGMKSLEGLQVPSSTTDEDLAIIGGMPLLRQLVIPSSPVTNDGLSHLKSLKSLQQLIIRAEGITISGFAHLRGLPLKNLALGGCRLDESRWTAIGELTQLEDLNVADVFLQDEDLASIGKLKRLKKFRYYSARASAGDGGMAHLSKLPALEFINVTFPLTDEGLKHLAKLTTLRHAQIRGEFSNAGLQQLQTLKSLMHLAIYTGKAPSPAALERLNSKLPWVSSIKVWNTSNPSSLGEAIAK